uniref:Uncharacterized protein n=1 Tax=Panagrolaimus davidi TaxID=227884 RepID=A0A914QP55_9BILA
MSLYYKERSDEEIADLENDKIVFTFPWIIELPPHPNGVLIRGRITTAYGVVHSSWHMYFSRIGIKLRNYNFSNQTRVWNGTCFISYNLFCDTDMRYLFHGSIPCRRIVLNLTSKLMRMRFAEKKRC